MTLKCKDVQAVLGQRMKGWSIWNSFVFCQMNKYSSLVDGPREPENSVRFPWISPCEEFSWANSWISMCLLLSGGLLAHSKLLRTPRKAFPQLTVTPHLPCHLQILGTVFMFWGIFCLEISILATLPGSLDLWTLRLHLYLCCWTRGSGAMSVNQEVSVSVAEWDLTLVSPGLLGAADTVLLWTA